jgi:hypothetical protein
MSVVQFQCPSCQAPLRLQNRALFVGRTFDCPDCGGRLRIEASGDSEVKALSVPDVVGDTLPTTGQPFAVPTGVPRTHSSRFAETLANVKPRDAIWDRLSRRPAIAGWIVAACFGVVLLIIVNSGDTPSGSPSSLATSGTSQSQDENRDRKGNGGSKPSDPENPNEHPPAIEPRVVMPDQTPGLPVPPEPAEPVVVAVPVEPKSNEANLARPMPFANDPPKNEPAQPAEPPPLTIEQRLQQKIARFEQSEPVPLVKLLETVEELAGVPIVWDVDRVNEQSLQMPVTLHLKQTTVGEILDALLKQAGLERRTVGGKIELRPMTQDN